VVDEILACISSGDLSQIKQLPISHLQILATYASQMDILLGMAHCNQCSTEGTVLSANKLLKAEDIIRLENWGVVSVPAAKESMSTSLQITPVQKNVEQVYKDSRP